jgi:hypothetical protein
MDRGIRSRDAGRMAGRGAAAIIAAVCGSGAPQAAETPVPAGRVEIVHFAKGQVRIVRGAAAVGGPVRRETVSFGNAAARSVTIVRGTEAPGETAAPAAPSLSRQVVEQITFAGAASGGVTVVRGIVAVGAALSTDLFAPAGAAELDRIAHAVHGAESSHGTNPGMWRPEPDGPQGPMQVSEAAARDVGGGDRFDIAQNRRLGRAYLARMFGRYGNWPDALAAYNWGPGNVDRWIAAGRNAERLPLETTRYIDRVLHDALITTATRVGWAPAPRNAAAVPPLTR